MLGWNFVWFNSVYSFHACACVYGYEPSSFILDIADAKDISSYIIIHMKMNAFHGKDEYDIFCHKKKEKIKF